MIVYCSVSVRIMYHLGSWNSLSHGLGVFQQGKYVGKETLKLESRTDASKVPYIFLSDY